MLIFTLIVGVILLADGYIATGAIICVLSVLAITNREINEDECDEEDEDW